MTRRTASRLKKSTETRPPARIPTARNARTRAGEPASLNSEGCGDDEGGEDVVGGEDAVAVVVVDMVKVASAWAAVRSSFASLSSTRLCALCHR